MDREFNRRSADKNPPESKVRQDIMEQLSEIDSPEYRVILTMMLRMQDETNVYFSTLQGHMIQIHSELAKLQRTDEQIKAIALNVHNEKCSTYHSWIDTQMQLDAQCGLVLNKHGTDGLCEHARKLLEEEKVAKVRRWKIMDGVTEKVILVILGVLVAAFFPHISF